MKPPADYSETIYVVTGTHVRAEELDRPLAYRIKKAIDDMADDERHRAVVLTDILYLNTPSMRDRPVIAVGGPRFNALARSLYTDLPYALAVDNEFIIQLDVLFEDKRVAVWGIDHETTVTAIDVFIEKYADKFVAACWGLDR